MGKLPTSRRGFLGLSVGAIAGGSLRSGHGMTVLSTPDNGPGSYVEIIRPPDAMYALLEQKNMVPLVKSGTSWTYKDIAVETSVGAKVPAMSVRLTAPYTSLSHLHLRWLGKQHADLLCRGDAWERSYGDLAWQSIVPERVMPWYFLIYDGRSVHGYGVRTQPAGMCFWQLDREGISLWIDLRNGGEMTRFGARTVELATVVAYQGQPGEDSHFASQKLCKQMCPVPRLPRSPIYGFNDWNYAYGSNTAEGITRDADLLHSLKPSGSTSPTLVIDDGWQDPKRFPSMSNLASAIRQRGIEPGLWIRPLRAQKQDPESFTLPQQRYPERSGRSEPGYDPTTEEGMKRTRLTVKDAVLAGYTFIKHDFSTYELLGRWGNEMGPSPTGDGWHFQDRSRTNAEIILDLYRALRDEAGEHTVILGCNTIGHLAAGLFESQRIGDDTSGRDWERTRRMGVNALAHRAAQHRTFSYIDPDCVAVTKEVAWAKTKQWLDVVARTGTSLFVSPSPDCMDTVTKDALREAFATAAQSGSGYPIDSFSSTVPANWKFGEESHQTHEQTYEWTGEDGASPFQV